MFEIDCTSCIWPRFPKAWIYQIAHMQNLFCTNCFIPLFDLGLLVQNHVQQGFMDFESIKPNLRNLFMKKLTRDRVVPIISASIS